MQKDDLVYVGHMLDMATSAIEKLGQKNRSEYDADETLRLALAYLVQTIGEAATKVSAQFKDNHAGIPWRKIQGIRHRIVHDYLHVDYDILWGVVTLNLPELLPELRRVAGEE